tara:strand:+ start:6403 stop:6666 length:264 start_codon:yes stop_codon:yes gene_type:complete
MFNKNNIDFSKKTKILKQKSKYSDKTISELQEEINRLKRVKNKIAKNKFSNNFPDYSYNFEAYKRYIIKPSSDSTKNNSDTLGIYNF